jgi:hypothetical protein
VYSGSGDPLALFSSGCWTCAFRNVKCEQEKPCCAQCSKVGIVCEYDEPAWFNDDELQVQQREINKRLIKQQKARLSSARRLSSKPTNPRPKLAPKSFTLATQKPKSAKMVIFFC